MGCDIHAYIERKFGNSWISISDGQLNLARDYNLFSIMANVRSGAIQSNRRPKGFPDKISHTVLRNLFHIINNEKLVLNWHSITESDSHKYCSPDAIRLNISGEHYVIDEEYHSISYFNASEIHEINKEYRERMSMDSADCMFICDMLSSIENRYQAECRIIIWFDN